jgi:hypothetical protein
MPRLRVLHLPLYPINLTHIVLPETPRFAHRVPAPHSREYLATRSPLNAKLVYNQWLSGRTKANTPGGYTKDFPNNSFQRVGYSDSNRAEEGSALNQDV